MLAVGPRKAANASMGKACRIGLFGPRKVSGVNTAETNRVIHVDHDSRSNASDIVAALGRGQPKAGFSERNGIVRFVIFVAKQG